MSVMEMFQQLAVPRSAKICSVAMTTRERPSHWADEAAGNIKNRVREAGRGPPAPQWPRIDARIPRHRTDLGALNSWRIRAAEITRARCAAEHPGMNTLWTGGVPRQRAD